MKTATPLEVGAFTVRARREGVRAINANDEYAVSDEQNLRLLNEQAMIERALENRANFEPIYVLYSGPVYRLCLRASGDPDLADDLTAKVFLTVLERLHTYSPKPNSTFRSWLFVVAKNTVRDHWRRTNRIHRLFDDRVDIADDDPGPEEIAIHRVELGELRIALDSLNERHRTIIEFRLSGLTSAEIAQAMGITISALKSAQTRAYASIRQQLAHKGGSR